MAELKSSSTAVQGAPLHLRITEAPTQNVDLLDPPCLQHGGLEERDAVWVCGQVEVLFHLYLSLDQLPGRRNLHPAEQAGVVLVWSHW